MYKINAQSLRYIIPFQYEGSFEDICSEIDERKISTNRKIDVDDGIILETTNKWTRKIPEKNAYKSDLYEYIRDEFCFDTEHGKLSDAKVGCQWFLRFDNEIEINKCADDKQVSVIKELLYYPNGMNNEKQVFPEKWKIQVTDVGLILCRNGLGFIWYEIGLPNEEITSEQLKSFQNHIRFLNRTKKSHVWEACGADRNITCKSIDGEDGEEYVQPFSLGNWISTELLCNLKVNFFSQKEETTINGSKHLIPYKAILFSYASFDGDNQIDDLEEKQKLVYHLTNGYVDTYHVSGDTIKEMKQPFADAFWYATQEGASYFVWPKKDNVEVFNQHILNKVKIDYFILYMKILYQSYSLLIYAERIQSEISAINCRYIRDEYDEHISKLFGEINLFLTKSMATSVSTVHHQSAFYIYLREQLRVLDDVKSVTSGLHALDALQRDRRQREDSKRIADEWKEEQRRDHEARIAREERDAREKRSDGKLQAIMGIFAMLGISSALVDCFDFIARISGAESWSQLNGGILVAEIIAMVVIGVVGIIAVYFAVRALIDAFRDK